MDGLTLLRRARDAGLRVEAAGDKLLIRGPKRAEPVVKLLAEHKAQVLAALTKPAADAAMLEELAAPETELIAPPPCFQRMVPPAEGEPGFDEPCVARRGRVEERPDGLFLHFCAGCGRWGAYGYGVNLRAGGLGCWYCREHRSQGESR